MCELKQYINRAQNQNESSWHRNKTAILNRFLSVKLLNQNNVCLNIRFLFYNGKFHFPKQQRKCGMCTYDKQTVLRWSVVVYQGKNWFNTCDRKSNGSCVNILLTTQWSYTKAIDQYCCNTLSYLISISFPLFQKLRSKHWRALKQYTNTTNKQTNTHERYTEFPSLPYLACLCYFSSLSIAIRATRMPGNLTFHCVGGVFSRFYLFRRRYRVYKWQEKWALLREMSRVPG